MFKFTLVLVLPMVMAWWDQPNTSVYNTDTCIVNLGGILPCNDRNAIGLPNNLSSCCNGLRKVVEDGCFCNPTIEVLLGGQKAKFGLQYLLQPLCRLIQPLQWILVDDPDSGLIQNCERYETSEYGCDQSDMEIDAGRMNSVLSFGKIFTDTPSNDSSICFSTQGFIDSLEQVGEEPFTTFVPYGVGTYNGFQDSAEYLGLVFSGLNSDYWRAQLIPRMDMPQTLFKSENGTAWTLGGFQRGSFDGPNLPYEAVLAIVKYKFAECKTKFHMLDVQANEGMKFLVERYVNTAMRWDRYGVRNICEIHERYCTGSLRQYDSFEACVSNMTALPAQDPECGDKLAMSGYSRPCKFKHQWMVATNPSLHCPHIGLVGTLDINGNSKCNAETECTTSDILKSSAWESLDLTRDPQEAAFVAAQQISDANLPPRPASNYTPNWPFGCAV